MIALKNIMTKSAIAIFLGVGILISSGCERDIDDLMPATYPSTPEVFIDGFSAGLQYAAFGGSKVTAFDVDTDEKYRGSASMKFAVPDAGDPEGAYAGGSYFVESGRDLSDYDALTFWAKASKSAVIDLVGFGNDLADSRYQVILRGVAVNTNWKKIIIPIPDPARLVQEKGMFFYSEGPEEGLGYTFWIDELQFEKLGTLARPAPAILEGENSEVTAETGQNIPIGGLVETFNLPNGIDQKVEVAPGYFTFSSNQPSIATVNGQGVVSVIDSGTAVITAKLGQLDASGSLTIRSTGSAVAPVETAPSPTVSPDSVISLFSNAYTNVPVDTWNTRWQFSTAEDFDIQINGDDVKRYRNLNFVGIEFSSQTIDASAMTHFHLDLWTPDPIALPASFKVLLVDFGANGTFDGGDDASHEIAVTSPVLESEKWITLDIPLTEFRGLVTRAHLAQLVFSGDLPNVYIDNVYFYQRGSSSTGGPGTAAPEPARDPSAVLSIFSDAYANLQGTDFNPDWGQATVVSQIPVDGNNTLVYSGLNYQGTQLSANLDVSGFTHLHLDYWTENSSTLNIYLISPGPIETPYVLTVPSAGWMSVDIPLSNFTPVDLRSLIQFKFDGNGDIYLDNLYFFQESTMTGKPMVAAPTPTNDPGQVISVFSDAFENIEGTDFNPNWGQATLVDQIPVDGNNTLFYSQLDYQGIQLGSNQDISSMTHLHVDVWTANSTGLSIFLISPGPVETPVSLAVPTSGWSRFDISLDQFSPVDLMDVFQFKFEGDGDVYLDNLYFYVDGGVTGDGPPMAAADPLANPADVISLFSEVYSDVSVDTWRTDWSSAVLEEISVAGNQVKKYSTLDFVGIETVASPLDVSEMTHFHLDVWSADFTFFAIKLVDFGADGAFGGGDDVEHQVEFNMPERNSWVSFDIPLSDFNGLTTRSNLAQYILVGQPTGNTTIYVDNVYFHK